MTFNIFPLHAADFYKVSHRAMYPRGATRCYSNFTARSDKLAVMPPGFDERVVNVGLQGTIAWMLIDWWKTEFFDRPLAEVVSRYKRRMDSSLGPDTVPTDHVAALHKVGYLPLRIKALPEGSRVNLRVPFYTVVNTHDDFPWLTNYIESALSAECWKSYTNATIAYEYRKLLTRYAVLTGSPREFVAWQGHDFSLRGMCGIHDGAARGAAHLSCFTGTDTICAIDYVERFYPCASDYLIGGSVPATEHSVMSFGGQEAEIETFERLMDMYPTGILSIVADTWDFWQVLTVFAPQLKQKILDRKPNGLGQAKIVFRPDSGDPVKIICGDPAAPLGSPARRGAVSILWDIFGGTTTSTGHRMLSERVGLIYGDSITLARAHKILESLHEQGFASANIVFGIGSYTYQHSTRDTFGHAYKATWGMVDGQARELFKNPVTDDGRKRSARGLLRVEHARDGDNFVLFDEQTPDQEQTGLLQTVFLDGEQHGIQSLSTIRQRLGWSV